MSAWFNSEIHCLLWALQITTGTFVIDPTSKEKWIEIEHNHTEARLNETEIKYERLLDLRE